MQIITYIRLSYSLKRIRRTGIVIKTKYVVAEGFFLYIYSLDFNSVSCEGTTERYACVGRIIGRTTSQFLFMAATSLVRKRVVIISSDSVGDNNAVHTILDLMPYGPLVHAINRLSTLRIGF